MRTQLGRGPGSGVRGPGERESQSRKPLSYERTGRVEWKSNYFNDTQIDTLKQNNKRNEIARSVFGYFCCIFYALK